MRKVVLAVGILLVGCSSNEELINIQRQLNEIDKDIASIEEKVVTKQDFVAFTKGIEDEVEEISRVQANLREDVKELVARLEVLKSEIDDTNARLAQLSQETALLLKQMKKSLESVPGSGEGVPLGGGEELVDPKSIYENAYNDYLQGNYDLAIATFQSYLKNYPDTELSDNALYWIGESYYRKGEYLSAIKVFNDVAIKYPNSDKLASSYLKSGFAYLKIGNKAKAKEYLEKVVLKFPNTDEANLAKERLKGLEK